MTNFTTTATPNVTTEKETTYPRVMRDKDDRKGVVLQVGCNLAFTLGEYWSSFDVNLMEDYNGTITLKCGNARDE